MDAATSSPNGTQDESRRKSGRVVKRPDIFAEEDHQGSILSNGSAKRKRTPISKKAGTGDDEDEIDSDEGTDEDDSENEPDEEEVKEKRKAQRKPRLLPNQQRSERRLPILLAQLLRSAPPTYQVAQLRRAQRRKRPEQDPAKWTRRVSLQKSLVEVSQETMLLVCGWHRLAKTVSAPSETW